MGFVANFIRFPSVQNFENRLRLDKVAESLKVGTFLRHSVYAQKRQHFAFKYGHSTKVMYAEVL